MKKGDKFSDKTDSYVYYTFTGKEKEGRTIFEADKFYQFEETPKNKHSNVKPRIVYKSDTWVKDYFVKLD